jgi:2-dehydro-3-deoxyphosphooctonate aldolase (KDO 8-P synthase)
MRQAGIGSIMVGENQPFLWIAGPCVIQSLELCLSIADHLSRLGQSLGCPIVFKASFDKANRTAGKSFRGPGLDEGLRILEIVRQKTGLPITTDVHEPEQVAAAGQVVDVIQIPAFLARQTNLVQAAGRTGKTVNVKKGQFMAPWDMKNVVAKLAEVGCENTLLTERGTTFGYGNLVNDMRAIPWMQEYGKPVIFDATHSVQTPGSQGDRTGGDRKMVPYLACAAVAAGCDGIFIETHPRPEESPSDGPNMMPLDQIAALMAKCLRIRSALRECDS